VYTTSTVSGLKKIPFKLLVGSKVWKSGYAQLNTVKRNLYSHTYEVTLYDIANDFLTTLAGKQLKDLAMPFNNLQHEIDKETVKES